jgi:hypothetical protein
MTLYNPNPEPSHYVRRYVVRKDSRLNIVYVSRSYYDSGRRQRRDAFSTGPISWLSAARPDPGIPMQCKVGGWVCSTVQCSTLVFSPPALSPGCRQHAQIQASPCSARWVGGCAVQRSTASCYSSPNPICFTLVACPDANLPTYCMPGPQHAHALHAQTPARPRTACPDPSAPTHCMPRLQYAPALHIQTPACPRTACPDPACPRTACPDPACPRTACPDPSAPTHCMPRPSMPMHCMHMRATAVHSYICMCRDMHTSALHVVGEAWSAQLHRHPATRVHTATLVHSYICTRLAYTHLPCMPRHR